MLRYFIFIEYGLLPDLTVGVLISASRTKPMVQANCTISSLHKRSIRSKRAVLSRLSPQLVRWISKMTVFASSLPKKQI